MKKDSHNSSLDEASAYKTRAEAKAVLIKAWSTPVIKIVSFLLGFLLLKTTDTNIIEILDFFQQK